MLKNTQKLIGIRKLLQLNIQKRFKYNKSVMEHYDNPKNVGSLDKKSNNVGIGLVGAPACGDVMKLSIEIDPTTKKIIDAKFKTFGCGSAIASSSYTTEIIKNKTLDEALKITNSTIANNLGLPPVKLHCSMLAEDSVKAAIDNYIKKNNKNK